MRWRDVVSFAAFAAIVVFVLSYFGTLGLRVQLPPDRIDLTMDVSDVNGIVNGSNVLLRGVPVGKVVSVDTTLHSAKIGFYVDGAHPIPTDTEVRLDNLSALGESYIEFLPHSKTGPTFTNGQHIGTESVVAPPSISELTTSVVRVLNEMDPGALHRIISEANAALPNPSATLPNLARASTLLNNAVASMDGKGRLLLGNFQTLIRNAEWVNPTLMNLSPYAQDIGRAIQDFYKAQPTIAHRNEPAEIINLNNLLARFQALLDTSGGDLKVLGEAFQPKLNMIAGTLMNFDTGQLLDHMLQVVPPDGTITLHVTP